MKIEIYKKENDENVYYTIDNLNERRLNFDSIKEISKGFPIKQFMSFCFTIFLYYFHT